MARFGSTWASGNFVSSSFYFKQLPDWVAKFNQSRVVDQWAGQIGTPSTTKAGDESVSEITGKRREKLLQPAGSHPFP